MLKLLFNKRTILKFLMSCLSFLLCFLLIFNAGIIDCFAVAGVDDVAILILIAIMATCGITFLTVDDARTAAGALFSNLGQGAKDLINAKAAEIATNATVIGAAASVGIGFLAEQWTQIMQGVIATFGDYTGIDCLSKIEGELTLSFSSPISIPVIVGRSSHVKYVSDILTLDVFGDKFDYSKSPDFISNIHSQRNASFIASLTICNAVSIVNSTYGTGNPCLEMSYSLNCSDVHSPMLFSGLAVGTASCPLYINGQPCTLVGNNSDGYILQNSSGINVIIGGILVGTNVPVSDSICPDGVFPGQKAFNDWITGLINGDISVLPGDDIPSVGALPGNPSIDAPAYPGNDTWHDGSINDDIAVGQPSIGIAVPTSDDDVTTLNPDNARDYANTTVKDKDFTDTDTNPENPADDKPSSGNPSKVLPTMSLPEILFKTKFPFCLPWDLYNLFNVLAAEPKTPKFVIPYKNDMLNIDEEYVLDFSKFDEAAKIIRFFCGAAFVLALVLISRKMIGSE